MHVFHDLVTFLCFTESSQIARLCLLFLFCLVLLFFVGYASKWIVRKFTLCLKSSTLVITQSISGVGHSTYQYKISEQCFLSGFKDGPKDPCNKWEIVDETVVFKINWLQPKILIKRMKSIYSEKIDNVL